MDLINFWRHRHLCLVYLTRQSITQAIRLLLLSDSLIGRVLGYASSKIVLLLHRELLHENALLKKVRLVVGHLRGTRCKFTCEIGGSWLHSKSCWLVILVGAKTVLGWLACSPDKLLLKFTLEAPTVRLVGWIVATHVFFIDYRSGVLNYLVYTLITPALSLCLHIYIELSSSILFQIGKSQKSARLLLDELWSPDVRY